MLPPLPLWLEQTQPGSLFLHELLAFVQALGFWTNPSRERFLIPDEVISRKALT
jgi:hypothetical protein